MDRRLQKLLLVLITITLAITPLRGAWAIADSPATDSGSHCDQMQDTESMADMQHDNHAGSAPDSKQDCNGSCCDDSCSTCVHGSSAISSYHTVTAGVTDAPINTIFPVTFTGRTVTPLLRPPTSPLA
ncbi:MAG TPA: hypothetical protein DCO71_08235 [Gammaproteobacteria bacterium]|nr:hypothetical protein [Gammaproteobacteria bacterium]